MDRIDLRIKPETLTALKVRAAKENRSISAMARLLIEKELAECNHEFQIFDQHGHGPSNAKCGKCGFIP